MKNTDSSCISLSNDVAECQISLFGANLVSYRPKGQREDVFWLGDLNKFDGVQAIRGGVPVCWPRFAEEELNKRLPRHGFARLSEWKLKTVTVDAKKIEAALTLSPDTKYSVNLSASLFIKITDKLEYCLETFNTGDEPFNFSEALHAYFRIGSLNSVIIKGLSGQMYRRASDGKVCKMENDLTIGSEFDASFFRHTGCVEIEDRKLSRVISIEKQGSDTTVIWNPHKDLAEMSKGQFNHFICVELANQGDKFITLQPQEKHKIKMTVTVSNLEKHSL